GSHASRAEGTLKRMSKPYLNLSALKILTKAAKRCLFESVKLLHQEDIMAYVYLTPSILKLFFKAKLELP
ncbi:MAG: hypothetical protein QW128_08250, partial [Thermoprotei archaeon]